MRAACIALFVVLAACARAPSMRSDSAVFDGSTLPGHRDARKWPFASESIWNTPIGSSAMYVPAGIRRATAYGMTVDRDLIVMRPEAPALDVMTTIADWDNTKDRCPPSQPVLLRVPLPTDFVFRPVLPDTPNAALAVLLQDGRTVKQTQPFSRCEASGPATSHYLFPDVDIMGAGISGAHGGSGLSALGGTLRMGELRRDGPPIRHVLKVELDGSQNFAACPSPTTCFRWPATQADSYAVERYAGPNSFLKPGALLALPIALDLSTLGLETEPALMLAWTLQNYGAYVVDDTAWSVYALSVEFGPDGDFAAQFEADWGFPINPAAKATPWARDMDRLFMALAVVDDNSPSSIGGQGMRVQPLASALLTR